jgi:hypothetical protein
MFQPVAQLGQTGDHRREIARGAGLEFIQKLPHGASAHCRLIKFYGEVHGFATSFLMYPRLRHPPLAGHAFANQRLAAGSPASGRSEQRERRY